MGGNQFVLNISDINSKILKHLENYWFESTIKNIDDSKTILTPLY